MAKIAQQNTPNPHNVEQALHAACIPLRYRRKGFDAFDAPDEARQGVKVAVLGYAEDFREVRATGRGLILFGNVGTGKTHLACAALIRIIRQGFTGLYTPTMAAFRAVKETWSRDAVRTERQALQALTDPDILVIDEVGVQFGTGAERLIMYDIINGRYERLKPTIIISNLDIKKLTGYLGERVMDRLREGGGKALKFCWDSHRNKIQARKCNHKSNRVHGSAMVCAGKVQFTFDIDVRHPYPPSPEYPPWQRNRFHVVTPIIPGSNLNRPGDDMSFSAFAATGQTAANATATMELFSAFKENTIEWLTANWMAIPTALIIFFVGKWLAKILTTLLHKVLEKQKLDPILIGLVSRTAYFALLLTVIIAAVSQIGVNVASLVAVFGTVALAIGLALKDSLSSFASGVMLALFRPFTTGDYVEAGGTSGTIERLNIFYTEMKSPDNKQIYIPNSKVMASTITNYSAKPIRRVDLVVGIGYEDDIDKARTVMRRVLDADSRILADPAPVIELNELADSSVNFVVRPWVKNADYWPVYWHLTEAIKKAFDAEGISIPYPQQDVHVHMPDKVS